MRILIATDQTEVPATLRSILDGIGGVEAVQQATNPQLALHLTKLLRPDVLIVDLSAKAQGEGEWASVLAWAMADTKLRVLLLSRSGSGESFANRMAPGLAGCVSRDAAATELPQAIDTLRKGGVYFSFRQPPAAT